MPLAPVGRSEGSRRVPDRLSQGSCSRIVRALDPPFPPSVLPRATRPALGSNRRGRWAGKGHAPTLDLSHAILRAASLPPRPLFLSKLRQLPLSRSRPTTSCSHSPFPSVYCRHSTTVEFWHPVSRVVPPVATLRGSAKNLPVVAVACQTSAWGGQSPMSFAHCSLLVGCGHDRATSALCCARSSIPCHRVRAALSPRTLDKY